MAVRIPVYTQQTRTPGTLVSGANISTDPGPGIAGALGDVAQGLSVMGRVRIQEREELESAQATAYAAKAAAQFHMDTLRDEETIRQEVGAGAVGYTQRVNEAAAKRRDELLASAPSEKSRTFLSNQFQATLANLDQRSFDYEIGEGRRLVVEDQTAAIESAAGAAAADPGSAQVLAAQQIAAIKANKVLTETQRATLVENVVQGVSFGAVLGDTEKDPYLARTQLRRRLNFAGDSDAPVDQGVVGGIMAEANRRAQAGESDADIEAWMGDALTKAGVKLDTSQAGEDVAPDGRDWAYNALSVPKVVELLSRVDAEIARRENQAQQQADVGKITMKQEIENTMAALASGESVPVPNPATLAFVYGPEEGAIQAQKFSVVQALSGDLQKMNGQSNQELTEILASRPTGTDNRQFRDQAYEIRAQRANAVMAARTADPGGFVLTTNKPVAFAYEQFQTLAQTPDADPQAVFSAQARYLVANAEAQARLGVLVPKLPAQFVEFSKTRFAEGLAGQNPQMAVAQAEATAASLANQPDMLNQYVTALGDIGHLAVNGVDSRVLTLVQNASKTSEKDKKDLLLAGGYTWSQIETAVAKEFAPLYSTFSFGRDNPNAVMYSKAATQLVADRVLAGESPEAASRAVYSELFSEKNAVVDRFRVDRRVADPDTVKSGLDAYVRDLSPDAIAVNTIQPWMDADAQRIERETMLRTIRRSAYWLNDATGQNVILMWANGAVNDASGKPITMPISDAALYQPENISGNGQYGGPASVGRID